VLEQRKTILKVLLNCVSSQKNKFMVLDKRKYRIGIFTELCLTAAHSTKTTGAAPRPPPSSPAHQRQVIALIPSGVCSIARPVYEHVHPNDLEFPCAGAGDWYNMALRRETVRHGGKTKKNGVPCTILLILRIFFSASPNVIMLQN